MSPHTANMAAESTSPPCGQTFSDGSGGAGQSLAVGTAGSAALAADRLACQSLHGRG